MYLGFVEMTMGQLSLTHHAAHGTESQEIGIGDMHSERFLDDMKATFPFVYLKLTYPIWENNIGLAFDILGY